jgi:sugar phosphate isomerase/epimerase
LGYEGVFITLDVGHLDPESRHLDEEIAEVKELLATRNLNAVIETGARYLLDPTRKHWPVLLSKDGNRRERFLGQAIDIAAKLDAPVVSFWSGINALGVDTKSAFQLLAASLDRLIDVAVEKHVTLALEPEPGMLIERVQDFHRVRSLLKDPYALKLSLDCGHLLVTGEASPEDVLLQEQENLACVAIEDMTRGVHEHLPFGEGDVRVAPLLDALDQIQYTGVVAVELGRHSHEGAVAALRSKEFLMRHGVSFRQSL